MVGVVGVVEVGVVVVVVVVVVDLVGVVVVFESGVTAVSFLVTLNPVGSVPLPDWLTTVTNLDPTAAPLAMTIFAAKRRFTGENRSRRACDETRSY